MATMMTTDAYFTRLNTSTKTIRFIGFFQSYLTL